VSITVTYRDGVFEPIEDLTNVHPRQNYTAFSDEELAEILSTTGLKAAEKSPVRQPVTNTGSFATSKSAR
jgi:hypothetical protein